MRAEATMSEKAGPRMRRRRGTGSVLKEGLERRKQDSSWDVQRQPHTKRTVAMCVLDEDIIIVLVNITGSTGTYHHGG